MNRGFFLFLFCISAPLFSQQLGLTGSVVAFVPKYEYEAESYNSQYWYALGHTKNRVWPGIRIEGTYLKKDALPRIGYRGIAFTYLIPKVDSANYSLRYRSGSSLLVLGGLQRNSIMKLTLRSAYEIPQSFNDFLMINIGLGGGIVAGRFVYLLPENTATRTYNKEDFDPESFGPFWRLTVSAELFTGVAYELEHFSIVGQYAFSYTPGEINRGGLFDSHFGHQLTAGIFYPLKQY